MKGVRQADISEVEKAISKIKKKVIIIGIAGGSASGKTTVARLLKGKILSMDDYYKGINDMEDNNFDDPKSQDLDLLREHLIKLKNSETIKKPIYDFKTHSRIGYEEFKPAKLIIVEGLFALNEKIRDLLDIKVFIECKEDERFRRRMERDISERGRTEESVIKQWNETVEPMFKKFVLGSKKDAIIIKGEREFS